MNSLECWLFQKKLGTLFELKHLTSARVAVVCRLCGVSYGGASSEDYDDLLRCVHGMVHLAGCGAKLELAARKAARLEKRRRKNRGTQRNSEGR
jgi:hypothetical protein